MKKLISLAACLMAVVLVAVSCTPKDKPDGKCELTAFSLSSAIAGTIDAAAKTITVVIPTSVTSNSFTPTFKVTDYDLVTIGGIPATSGETAVTITDGTKVVVSDDVSALTTEYTIVVKANDQKAELLAVSFMAADNSLLEEDVTPEEIASEMVVRVPEEAFRQELTLTVEAGFNDEVSVNGTAVASGSAIKVDTNFPIDITVTDALAATTVNYVLKVGKILQYLVFDLGTYQEGTLNDFTMAVNPADNMPYFAYTRKLTSDEKNWGVSLARWNGSAFELVGPTAIADASARSASKPMVAFASDGTPYVKYLGGDVASKPTVKKLSSEWTLVGDAGFTPQNNNTSYYSSFFVHPSGNKPMLFWTGNTKSTDTYRSMGISVFDGDSWASNGFSGVIPAYGSGSTATSGMYYGSSAALSGDKVFMVSSFNEFGYYVHEVNADGSLSVIVDNYLPEDAPHGLPANLQMRSGADGALYILAAVRVGEGSMQIFTVDQSEKTLKAYGAGYPVTISANGGISTDFGFAVNPLDGFVMMAVDDTDATSILYLDDNLQWATLQGGLPVGKSAIAVNFDALGNGYVAYQSGDAIQLFKVALEEDILPE